MENKHQESKNTIQQENILSLVSTYKSITAQKIRNKYKEAQDFSVKESMALINAILESLEGVQKKFFQDLCNCFNKETTSGEMINIHRLIKESLVYGKYLYEGSELANTDLAAFRDWRIIKKEYSLYSQAELNSFISKMNETLSLFDLKMYSYTIVEDADAVVTLLNPQPLQEEFESNGTEGQIIALNSGE